MSFTERGPLRRAGTGIFAGNSVTWSVAEGDRGRRWRSLTMLSGELRLALLLELDRNGRVSRLELTTRDGLLTLHPGPDGTLLHGNVVSATGVRHTAMRWSDSHELVCAGDPITVGAVAHRHGASIPEGETAEAPVVFIDSVLGIHRGSGSFGRDATGRWRFEARLESASDAGIPGESEVEVQVDDQGCPRGFADAGLWPLEQA